MQKLSRSFYGGIQRQMRASRAWDLFVGKAKHIKSHRDISTAADDQDKADIIGNEEADTLAKQARLQQHEPLDEQLIKKDKQAFDTAKKALQLAGAVLQLWPDRPKHRRQPAAQRKVQNHTT